MTDDAAREESDRLSEIRARHARGQDGVWSIHRDRAALLGWLDEANYEIVRLRAERDEAVGLLIEADHALMRKVIWAPDDAVEQINAVIFKNRAFLARVGVLSSDQAEVD